MTESRYLIDRDYPHVVVQTDMVNAGEMWDWCRRYLEPGTWARSIGYWRFTYRESSVAFSLARSNGEDRTDGDI